MSGRNYTKCKTPILWDAAYLTKPVTDPHELLDKRQDNSGASFYHKTVLDDIANTMDFKSLQKSCEIQLNFNSETIRCQHLKE